MTTIQQFVTKINSVDFNDDSLNLAFKYYCLKWVDDPNHFVEERQQKNKLILKLESDLTQAVKADSWTHTLARFAFYSQRFLLEQALRREKIIYDDTSPFDKSINNKLTRLAGRIANDSDSSNQAEAMQLFTDIAKNFTVPKDKAKDLIAEHDKLAQKTYSAIRSQLCHLINPKDSENVKSPGMNNPRIVNLLTFLLDLQDSSHQEFDGFDLLANIRGRFFSSEITEEPNYHQKLEQFSKLLIDIFFQFETSPTGPYQDFEKLALLEYYKRLVNQFSDQYNLPYRIKKIKHTAKGKKYTEKHLIIKNCERLFGQLHADNINDTSISEPSADEYINLSLVSLKKLDAKLADCVNTYHQAATIAQQCVNILGALEGFSPYNELQQQPDFITTYAAKAKQITDETTNNAKARLEKFAALHTEIFNQLLQTTKHLSTDKLITLTDNLFAIYPYVPRKYYSHYHTYYAQYIRLRNELTAKNIDTKTKELLNEKLSKLVEKICRRIAKKHIETRPKTYVNFTPDGRKFEFDYETRHHSYAQKKARRTDKATIFAWSWPLRITLAAFQAAVSFGGTVEFFSPLVAGWIAMTVGFMGFIFSYISNDQLVYNPLYRLLIDAFLDNSISKAESTLARNLFKIIFLLCIGTGLTMAIVALSFSLSLFTQPTIALLIALAALDVIPTTLGFGALMFKTFEDFILSIVNFFKALTPENCKFLLANTYNRLSAANTEDRAVLILTGILTPLIIASAIGLTAFTTIGMIGAWYIKVSAFFVEHLGFSTWASSAAAFVLAGVCSMPIRSVFNIKNVMWMGFFSAEFVGRYGIVKPLLAPFKAAKHLQEHSDTIIDASIYHLCHSWAEVRDDPHLYAYRKWYRFKRTLDVTSWFALIWSCVAFNGLATGMAASKGGAAIRDMTGLGMKAATATSVASNASLSLGANSKSMLNKMKMTPGSSNDMPIEEIVTEDNPVASYDRNKFRPPMPKAIKQLKTFGLFKPRQYELIVDEQPPNKPIEENQSIYRCAKNKITHNLPATRGGYVII